MIKKLESVLRNAKELLTDDLYIEEIINNKEALVNKSSVIIVDNGEFTGRSHKIATL